MKNIGGKEIITNRIIWKPYPNSYPELFCFIFCLFHNFSNFTLHTVFSSSSQAVAEPNGAPATPPQTLLHRHATPDQTLYHGLLWSLYDDAASLVALVNGRGGGGFKPLFFFNDRAIHTHTHNIYIIYDIRYIIYCIYNTILYYLYRKR